MKLITEHPIAVESVDHRHPRGARQDNTHCPEFVRECARLFGPLLRMLDLGCAGGGLVNDFIDAELLAIGLEGSDYPMKHGLGAWTLLRNKALFTCDITKPFDIVDTGNPVSFDLVTAWDVLEHIQEEDLPALFANIRNHLKPGGLFMASICTRSDVVDGREYHQTVRDQGWWVAKFIEHGLHERQVPITHWPRGSGNPLATGDWCGREWGFHIAAGVRG